MTHPNDRKYAKTHEWFMLSGDLVTVGITPFAANELTDITYIDLPKVGKTVKAGQACGEIESVKATAELFCAVSGTVVEVNDQLSEQPELLNRDALNAGWIFRIRVTNPSELNGLMDAPAYNKMTDAPH